MHDVVLLLLAFLPQSKSGCDCASEFPSRDPKKASGCQACEYGDGENSGRHATEWYSPFVEWFEIIQGSKDVISANVEGSHGGSDHKNKRVIPCDSCRALQHSE